MNWEINTVPSSQILPVSSCSVSPSVMNLKNDAEDFFLKKGLNCYRAFKNAHAISSGNAKSKQEFINIFLKVLEETLLSDQDQTEYLPEKKIIIKNCFQIIQSTTSVINNSNINFTVENFYAAVAGFLIGKLK